MEFSEFVNLVKLMRETQKKYFRLHSYEALNESKKLEKQVDEVIKEITESPQPYQPQLDF